MNIAKIDESIGENRPNFKWSAIAFLVSRRTALHSRLLVIESLVFLLPALVLIYILNQEHVSFDTNQILMLAGSLVIMLGGLLILHRIFDRLEQLEDLMTRAVIGERNLMVDLDDSGEIQEVLSTCNNLMLHYDQANEALEQHSSELYAVHELVELANRTLDLDVLLNALLENAMTLTDAMAGTVYTLNNKTKKLRKVGNRVKNEIAEDTANSELSESHLQQAITAKHSVLIDLEGQEEGSDMAQIITPVFVNDHPAAILTLRGSRALLKEKIAPKKVFSLMLREVAHALENAVSHRSLEQKVEERTKELAKRNQDMLLEIEMRKEMEIALVAARKEAEAANIAKTEFLSSMSHEIRTPMNGVIGMVDLLQQTKLNSEQSQMMQTVSASGQSLMAIIDDILDFSKIEANKMTLESIPLSLTDVVEGSIQSIATSATKKGLRLITYIDPKLPQFVMGDPGRLRQIIINLAGNAIKFTEAGRVVIRAEAVDNSLDNNITIRFSVTDQGIGISKNDQSKLFQFFSQVETSTTREYGGTGLGLAICKSLTDLMGGEIAVNSQLGEGSEFYAILPFLPCDKQNKSSTEIDLAGLRLLVINSDPIEQTILRQYLEHRETEIEIGFGIEGIVERCLAASKSGSPFDIAIVGPQWTYEEVTSLSAAAEQAGLKTRFIFLLMGTRHRVRVDDEERIFLDVNPLRRTAFISAVAIAAGRMTPELVNKEDLENTKPPRKTLTVEEAREQGTLILVAEDNATNRDLLGRQLTLLGYTYEMTEDGQSALEAWRNNDYALLLTDCRMPRMDGFDLSRAVRQHENGSGTRRSIIAITANALESEIEQCMASGMDDIITKPIDLKNLRHVLDKRMPPARIPPRLLTV